MRLGIFGGTFDPVHYAHLLLAESCREQLKLDQVWFLPAAVPPHKQQRELAPADARVEMLELAIAGQAAFQVSKYEIERGGVNYTADTLSHFKSEDPQRELFFLMGADSLKDLPNWRDPARLCQAAIPVVVHRAIPGSQTDGGSLDFGVLSGLIPPETIDVIRQHQVSLPRIDLTSSDLRARVAEGRSIRYRTPRAVESYIESHGLYRSAR